MNNNQNYQQPQQQYQVQPNMNQQPPKKKSKVGLIVLIVFVCLLPVILLIFIMLVSLGVLVYNNAAVKVDTQMDNINSIEISMFNSRYESYIGNDKTMSHVISLVQMTKANNNYEDNKVDISILLKDHSTYSLNDFSTSLLSSSSKYDISAEKNSMGYIDFIYVKEK